MDWIYAILTVVAVFSWPWELREAIPQPYLAVALVVNGLVAANAWYQCSSAECPFFTGLRTIAGSMMSGCVNITILYMPFLMVGVYAASVCFSAAALFQGREQAQRRFRGVVEWFDRRRISAPLNPFNHMRPLDPALAPVNPEDPESILEVAAIWDQSGEWDRAIEIYRNVRERWPGEHGRYAGNCISEIERKKASAEGA